MNPHPRLPRPAVPALFFLLGVLPCLNAEMLYHIPFDTGGVHNYDNLGTVGGCAEAMSRKRGHLSGPLPDQEAPPLLGPVAEDFSNLSHGGQVGPAVILPDSADKLLLDTPGDRITIAAWINFRPGVNKRQIIVSKTNLSMETKNGNGWAFMVHDSGALQFIMMGGITLHTENQTSEKLTPGQWHHVAVTAESGDAASTRYFIDGQEASSRRPNLGRKPARPNDHPIALGANAGAVDRNQGFSCPNGGALDDVCIWNEILDDGKLKALVRLPAVLSGSNAGMLNSLFKLFDAGDPAQKVSAGGKTWRFTSKIPNPRNEGDAWVEDNKIFLQLNQQGAGLVGM